MTLKEYYQDANHILIYHGRKVCKSQNPDCEHCSLHSLCENPVK